MTIVCFYLEFITITKWLASNTAEHFGSIWSPAKTYCIMVKTVHPAGPLLLSSSVEFTEYWPVRWPANIAVLGEKRAKSTFWLIGHLASCLSTSCCLEKPRRGVKKSARRGTANNVEIESRGNCIDVITIFRIDEMPKWMDTQNKSRRRRCCWELRLEFRPSARSVM